MDTEMRVAVIACRQILAKLVTISDARIPTALRDRALGAKITPTAESAPPPDAQLDGPSMQTHAPSKRLSLYAHYDWRMRRAVKKRDPVELMMLATMAMRDYAEYMGTYKPKRYEFHTEAVRELLTSWRGHHSREVAVWVGADERWVRRHRILNGCDADFGENRERDDGLLERAVKLANGGASVRTIADVLGTSKDRIARMLNGEGAAAC